MNYSNKKNILNENINRNKSNSIKSTSSIKKSIPGPINPLNFFVMALFKFAKKPLLIDTNYRAGIYLCVVSIGSVYFDIFRMPQTFLSNKYGILNQLFAKWAWGWTFSLLFCFIVTTSYVYTGGNTLKMRRHVLRLLIGTICWYICTGIFHTIENESGACHFKLHGKYNTDNSISNKHICKQKNGIWLGFDISGHIFLLVLCNLFISEEVKILNYWRRIERLITLNDDNQRPSALTVNELLIVKKSYNNLNTNVKLITVVVSLLSLFWDLLILVTVVYFHNMPSKLTAVVISVVCWFISYRYIFSTDITLLPTTPTKNLLDLSH